MFLYKQLGILSLTLFFCMAKGDTKKCEHLFFYMTKGDTKVENFENFNHLF